MTLTLTQRLLGAVTLALLLGIALLGYTYDANQRRKAELAVTLAPLQTAVARVNTSAESPDANDPLLRAPAFPRDPPDLGLASAILQSAGASGVTTGPIQTTTGSPEKVGDTTYRTSVVKLTISGSLPRILNFFDRVEAAGLRTVVFDNMHLEPSNGQWSVQLQILAYAQP